MNDQPPPDAHSFSPAHAPAGLIAAAGLMAATALGLVSTLAGLPTAALFPVWAEWALRVAPLPAVVLLWAVLNEAQFRVRTDGSAIHFRRGLSSVVRVPWREVADYFADLGRNLQDVAAAGGSLVHTPDERAPFAQYGPDYTVVGSRGVFLLDDSLAGVRELAEDVVANAPPGAPRRWEEASWVTCPRCGAKTAVSLWPIPPGRRVAYCDACHAPGLAEGTDAPPRSCSCGGHLTQETPSCSHCGEPLSEGTAG